MRGPRLSRAATGSETGDAVPRSLPAPTASPASSIDGAMAAHHRRRLRNLGHARSYDPPADGASGPPATRRRAAGNAVDVLVDGAQALPEIERAIRGARRHVHIAGWSITPHFALTRDEPPVVLRELLADAAERVDVRVLMWAGAPAHTFAPDRGTVARRARRAHARARRSARRATRARARCTATTRSS